MPDNPTARRRWRVTLWLVLTPFLLPALVAIAWRLFLDQPHWSASSHAATDQAPAPELVREAVIQAYAARTWGIRGGVAVHTWIAAKRSNAATYTRHEVIGWRLRRGGSALVQTEGRPDAMWFSNPPELLVDLRGEGVDAMIDDVEAAVAAYPYAAEYRTWPGPNSNTFTAFVARRVPELNLELPTTAIGKDYLAGGAVTDRAPSGTGYQVSLFGMAGITAALREGLELQLFGLTIGVRPAPFAVKLPGFGAWPRREVLPQRLPAPPTA